MKKRKMLPAGLLGLFLLVLGAVTMTPETVKAADAPWMTDHDIPAYQKKNMYETETVEISGVSVEDEEGNPVQEPVHFAIFNSTKQEMQEEVDSKDGKLPALNLIKDHNYTIFAQDENYKMDNMYVWVNGEGKIVNIKDIEITDKAVYHYGEVTSLKLQKRDTPSATPEEDRRVNVELYTKVKGAGGALANVKVIFTSDIETVEATSMDNGRGTVKAALLEDVNYMVSVESASWDIDPFPLAVKDKSEYGADKYPYDHTSCNRVGGAEVENWDILWLVNKGQTHREDTVLTNTNYGDYPVYADIAGNTTITGLDFKDCLVLDKELDKNLVTGLNGDYDVIDIKVVNPHRWEFCKFAAGDYTITEKVDENKNVKQVYYLKDNKLNAVDFTQIGNEVTFQMNSLSLYPVVVEYGGELEFDATCMTVKVVDEKGSPVEGLELYMASELYSGIGDLKPGGKTDAEGKWTYECDGMEFDDDVYYLKPVEGSNYICESPVEVTFGLEGWDAYILTVGGETYTGQEVVLTVKTPGGSTEQPEEPEFDATRMTVKVVDEKGSPVEGLELYLESENYPGNGDLKPGGKTDAEGKWIYECDGTEFDDDVYYLKPVEGSTYTCESPVEVIFGMEGWNDTYIDTVGGEAYTGQEVTLTVKAPGGSTEQPEQPEFDATRMTVKVVDEKGSPVEGLELYLASELYSGIGDLIPGGKTDVEGKWTYECDGNEFNDDTYSLKPVEGSTYTCDSPVEVTFGMEGWDTYIDTVGGEAYTGQEIVLTVKAPGGSTEQPEQPEFDATRMTVKVVDEKGSPVEGLELYLASELYSGIGDLRPGGKTDAEGKWTYECDGNEFNDDTYSLKPVEGSTYTCDSPVEVTFGMEGWDTYIDTVEGEAYTGQEVILTVKSTAEPEPEPSITDTASAVQAVSTDGGKVTVTVKGTVLPETLYYNLSYVNGMERGVQIVVAGQEVTAQGTAQERTFEVTIPSSADYPDATAWRISVALAKDGAYTDAGDINVDKTILTAATEQALKDAISEKETLDGSKYTEESWAEYVNAVKDAIALTAKDDATEGEYQNAIATIAEKKEALALKDTGSGEGTEKPGQGGSGTDDKKNPGQGNQNNTGSSQNGTKQEGAVKTGDTLPILPLAGLLISFMVIAGICVRKIRTR